MKEGFFESFDNAKIYFYEWNNVENPKGIVQIIHGMAEHAKRYAEFAKALNKAGFIVFAADHRAHGKTAGEKSLGLYDGTDLFEDTLQDQLFISKMLKEKYQLPLFIFGHSYGSFLTQAYIEKSSLHDKAILCGSALMKGRLEVKLARFIAKLTAKFKGKNAPAKLIEKLTFGGYDKKIKSGSWLNSDQKIANEYYKDKFNGKPMSAKFYIDFFSAFNRIYKKKLTESIAKNKPLLLIAGKEDPVGSSGKSVQKLHNFYLSLGIKDVRLKLYDGARHEIINEPIRSNVYTDVITFLKEKSPLKTKND